MEHSQFSVRNKTIVLTGACGLLGRTIASHCAALGARIACLDVNSEGLSDVQRKLGNDHLCICCDISDKESVNRSFSEVTKQFDKVDVLINAHQSKPKEFLNTKPETHSPELWDTVIKTNLNGTLYTCQAAAQCMIPQESGVIVNFGSTYGLVSPNPALYDGTALECPLAYVASKGAVIAMSKQLAVYWAPHNIRVNCVTPHGVYDRHEETFVKNFSRMTPINRMMNPEEILGTIVYLASDASSYVTGANMVVDGGWTTW